MRAQFELEEVTEPTPEIKAPGSDHAQKAAISVLMLALATLAKKTLVAFTKLFTLLTIGSAFWLWMSIPEPNTHQLVSLGMYATFTLVINWIVLRRGES